MQNLKNLISIRMNIKRIPAVSYKKYSYIKVSYDIKKKIMLLFQNFEFLFFIKVYNSVVNFESIFKSN